MDGTLTEAHIDFADMRARTNIPMGDLFTVMEAWQDAAAVKHSMDVILDIEAEAAKSVTAKEGLQRVLGLLRDRGTKVALVTRNTRASVQAFLDLIGPEWASVFSIVLTREFAFVKPDYRLLQHVSQEWGIPLPRLLMVGDSLEDVEVGNAAGTATCLVAGGGNEKPGAAPAAPPPGAVPTFAVTGLTQLAEQLEVASAAAAARAARVAALQSALLMPPADVSMIEEDFPPDLGADVARVTAPGSPESSTGTPAALESVSAAAQAMVGAGSDAEEADGQPAPLAGRVRLGWPARVAAGEAVASEGAPPPGLDFLDWLVVAGALRPGACSFPRMGAAAGGLATCETSQRGDRVLHVCCGAGGLTKLISSQGMRVVGVDGDVSAAQKRGLHAVPFSGRPLTRHSLQPAKAAGGPQAFDVLLLCCTGSSIGGQVPAHWWTTEGLQELRSALHPDGRLCAQVDLNAVSPSGRLGSVNPAAVINSFHGSGLTVVAWQLLRPQPGSEATQLRLVARQCEGA